MHENALKKTAEAEEKVKEESDNLRKRDKKEARKELLDAVKGLASIIRPSEKKKKKDKKKKDKKKKEKKKGKKSKKDGK